MAVDPRLVTIAPDEPNGVVAHLFDVSELEVSALDVANRTFVTLAVRAWAEAS